MGNRLSKIYTRTGDDGTTGLGDGSRVAKDDARVEAYGTVDEANSAIGMVLAERDLEESIRSILTDVQHDLFELGGELCIPGHAAITGQFIERLENELDAFNADLPKLKDPARFRAWLCGVARNTAFEVRRDRQRQQASYSNN